MISSNQARLLTQNPNGHPELGYSDAIVAACRRGEHECILEGPAALSGELYANIYQVEFLGYASGNILSRFRARW
jgi:hypothetical protein